MRLFIAPILAIVFATLFTFDTASAAPATLPDRVIDVDMKQADIREVLSVLGKIAGREVAADTCVRGTVDLRLKNTPVQLVLDALASKLHLTYEDDGAVLRVHCAGEAAAGGGTRISLALDNASLADAAESLARAAGLDGVDYRATSRPKIKVTLEGVRVATAILVLADASSLKIAVVKKRLVVTD